MIQPRTSLSTFAKNSPEVRKRTRTNIGFAAVERQDPRPALKASAGQPGTGSARALQAAGGTAAPGGSASCTTPFCHPYEFNEEPDGPMDCSECNGVIGDWEYQCLPVPPDGEWEAGPCGARCCRQPVSSAYLPTLAPMFFPTLS